MNDTESINDRVSFFYSFFQFAETLKTTEQRCSFYDMVFRYAFFGEHPAADDSFLYGTFLLIKPNIDTNVKFSQGGKKSSKKKEEDKGYRNKDKDKDKEEGLNNPLNNYPTTVEDVINLAENNCIFFPKEEAERYFNYRKSTDWKKKTGQQITVGGIVSDMKLWLMRSKQFNADMQQAPDTSDDECISDEQYEAEMSRKRNSRSPSMLEERT